MEIKILQVFYGKDGLPYKDKNRQVHFPITGTGFLGASNTTKIKFYYDELDNLDETTWVAVSKLPNGKVGSRVLESYLDEELNEHYALLELDNYYTQYKGDVFISLQGYQGGVDFDYDEDNSQYEIHGTPTIAATGSIKFTINYANQFVGSGETDNINFQRILAALGTKLGMRAYSEHVEELPSEGSPDVFYVVNDDPNNPNLANIYIWNENTRHYIWVGNNTLDLGDYYTKEQGEQFESGIGSRVDAIENQVQQATSGSPKGVYESVEALTTAFPNGDDNIYLVGTDWYYWNGTAWTDGGTYLSSLPDEFLDKSSSNTVENSVVANAFDDVTNLFKKSNDNIFNKYNCTKTFGVYLNGSNQYISYAASLIISIKIDGVVGNPFSFSHFVDFTTVLNGIRCFTSNNLPSIGDTSFVEGITNINQTLKRGNATLTSNATYLNIQYLFDTESNMKSYYQNVIDGLAVRKTLEYADSYIGYYLKVENSGFVPNTRTVADLPLSSNISKDQLNKATGTDLIKDNVDEITTYFQPSNINLFNKFNYLIEKGVYSNAQNQFVSFASSMIITIKIDGVSGDKFAFNNFNETFAAFSLTGIKFYTSNNVPSVGDTSFVQDFTANTNLSLKRGFGTLSSNATYLNIQYLFDTTTNMENNIQNIVNGLMLIVGNAYAETYHGYYNTVQESLSNNWLGKKLWWCGTSIPAGVDNAIGSPSNGKSYPLLVGDILRCTVYNKSIGSSMARANVRTGNYVNALSYNLTLAMTQTQEEKENLIQNWSTIRQVLVDPNTYESLDSISSQVIASSFDNILMPYLNGTLPMPDLFIIDHGHNDYKTYYTLPNGDPDIELEPTYENIQNGVLAEDTYMTANNYYNLKRYFGDLSHIPSWRLNDFVASVNRNCFKGAINFLCTLILHYNPRARIVFIGNLDDWQKPGVVEAQEYNAKSWEFPLIKMYEYTGFSEHRIPGTYNYWGNNEDYDLTVKDIYCKDKVHPHSDTTGKAIALYSKVIADKLKHIVV